MEYVNLGRSGLKVSRACLGAMNFGTAHTAPWCDEAQARRIREARRERGFTQEQLAAATGVSRSAVAMGVSPSSLRPPGNATSPRCSRSVEERLVSMRWVSPSSSNNATSTAERRVISWGSASPTCAMSEGAPGTMDV